MTTKTYYKITFPDNTCYIGTTSKHIYERWGTHLGDVRSTKGHTNKNVQAVYDKYGYDDWVFDVLFVEEGDKRYHSIRENTLIQETPNTLNINVGKYVLLSEEENTKRKNIQTKLRQTPEQKERRRKYSKEQWDKGNHSSKRRTKEEHNDYHKEYQQRKRDEKKSGYVGEINKWEIYYSSKYNNE